MAKQRFSLPFLNELILILDPSLLVTFRWNPLPKKEVVMNMLFLNANMNSVPPKRLQYLPEKWYKFHYFDTALFWSYEGQSHEVNIATQSYFQRSFWWAFKKYGICNHLRENWEPLKKWVHFPWTLRLLEPFQVDFRQKPFLIRFSTFIWPGYHEIILEFGQLYWELERNFQKLPQIFI